MYHKPILETATSFLLLQYAPISRQVRTQPEERKTAMHLTVTTPPVFNIPELRYELIPELRYELAPTHFHYYRY